MFFVCLFLVHRSSDEGEIISFGVFLVHRKDFITKLSFKSLCFQSEVFLVN